MQCRDVGTWFRENRRRLTGNGLYMDGGEPGRRDPADFHTASTRVLLCRLSEYGDVLHSITHRLLYWATNCIPDVYADLAFLPPPRDRAPLKKESIPWWTASGCKLSPTAFDIVAISISVQQEALNLPAALLNSGLQLGAQARLNAPKHPLIILGGNAAASVPFIHGPIAAGKSDSGLVDLVCIGDGIGWLRDFLPLFADWKRTDSSRNDFLRAIAAKIPGTYVPSLYAHETERGVTTKILPASESVPFPVKHRFDAPSAMLGYDGAFIPFSDEDIEETLPIGFGCAFKCRFCQTGWIRGALDVAPQDELIRIAGAIKAKTAPSDLNLLCADAASVAGIGELTEKLLAVYHRTSMKSLSLTALAARKDAFAIPARIGKREFTFGIEGVSERLRRYLGKPVVARTILDVVAALAVTGLRQLKLFFIFTGLERESDLREFEDLLKRIRSAAPNCGMTISFTPLFNAPFTPLQFDALRPVDSIIQTESRRIVEKIGAVFRMSSPPHEIRLMNLLCRAGRTATPALVRLSCGGHALYRETVSSRTASEAERMLKNDGIDIPALEAEREATLPWDDIQAGPGRRALLASFRQSKACLDQKLQHSAEARSRVAMPRCASGGVTGSRPKPVELRYWAWLRDGDGWRPAATLARALMADLFRAWPGGVKAYDGRTRIFRMHATSGLCMVAADFAADSSPPVIARSIEADAGPRMILDGPVADRIPDEDQFLYHVRITGDAAQQPGSEIELLLKRGKVPFQAIRSGERLRFSISDRFRKKAGIYSVQWHGREDATIVCTNRMAAFLGSDADRVLRHGATIGICAISEETCPVCGNKLAVPVKTMPGFEPPLCVVCPPRISSTRTDTDSNGRSSKTNGILRPCVSVSVRVDESRGNA